MSDSTSKSHAVDPQTTSNFPPKVQAKIPESVEQAIPEKFHQTGNPDSLSHDKGHSYVPERIAQAIPTSLEEKVPDAIHDTTGHKSAEKAVKEGATDVSSK